MRILGIDYGEKYMGLAVGDTDLKIATPLKEVGAEKSIADIKKIVVEEKVGQIVLGLPLSFKMEETKASRRVRAFGRQLNEELGLPIAYVNEVLTSDQVRREVGEKAHASAAALILQSYFDKK